MPTHIIHQQKVQLQTNMSADVFALQNRISQLLRNDLPARMEALFNQLCHGEKIIRIERLELNLGTVSGQNLEAEFSGKLVEQLSLALSGLQVNGNEIKCTEVAQQQSMIAALVYFLLNGYMPWYNSVKSFAEWEEALTQSFTEKEWMRLREELKRDNAINGYEVRRLALQFSESFLQKVLFQLHPALSNNWRQLYDELLMLTKEKGVDFTKPGHRELLWQKAIAVALSTADENEFAIEFLKVMNSSTPVTEHKQAIKSNKSSDAEIELNQQKQEGKEELPAEEFFTGNCGIVILHPFLLNYFDELGLLHEKKFRNAEMQHRAVLLLHYLATGETEVAEFNLILMKLLCGVDFEEPVANSIELTDLEKEESASLLKAVTQHWKPLKRTSAEGLQTAFFQREGKLKPTASGWLLVIEQKTIDMLLNKLPWGTGTIKLPWMKNTLHVEWC